MYSFDLFRTGYRSSPLAGDYLLHRGARANKPKALSTPTTAELGTKVRSEGRAVLVSAKTMPCPNKLGHFLAPNSARRRQPSLVGAVATLAVTRWRILEETRHIAPNDAKK
jgi:hypothetical protein